MKSIAIRTMNTETRPRHWAIVIFFLTFCLVSASAVCAQTEDFQKYAEKFGAQWQDVVTGEAVEDLIEAAPAQQEAFEQARRAWRTGLARVKDGEITIRAKGEPQWPKSLLVVLSAEDAAGTRLVSPTGFVLESDGVKTTVLEVDVRPWMPPPLLAVSIVVLLLYIFVLPIFFRIMRRRLEQPLDEASWSGKQAIALIAHLVMLPGMFAFSAGIYAMSNATIWFLWMASVFNSDMGTWKSGGLLLFICLYSVVVAAFYIMYSRQIRHYQDRFRRQPPQQRTLRQKLTGMGAFQIWIQIIGQVIFILPIIMTIKHGVGYAILVGLVMIVFIILASQAITLAWLRRGTKRFLDADDPIVREALTAFAAVDGMKVARKIYVLPEEDWPLPNAFVIGLGRKSCMIAVTESPLEKCSPDEVSAILLHEYGHFWERHTIFLTAFFALVSAGNLVFLLAGSEWMRSLGVPYPSSMTHPAHSAVILIGFMLAFTFLFPPISRFFERRADSFPRDFGKGEAMASAMLRLSDVTKAPLHWPRWLCWLLTHPSYEERLEFLRRPADTTKAKGHNHGR